MFLARKLVLPIVRRLRSQLHPTLWCPPYPACLPPSLPAYAYRMAAHNLGALAKEVKVNYVTKDLLELFTGKPLSPGRVKYFT